MAAVYFDIDQFGYTKEIHKLLMKEFGTMNVLIKKYVGSRKRDMGNLPEHIEGSYEKILCEKRGEEKDKVDFRINIEIMKDLRNPDIKYFIVASRDTDFVTIAEEIHRHGKNFGVLVIHNAKEKVSPKLKEVCDVILTIQDGRITQGYHRIKKEEPLEFREASTQTETEVEPKYTFMEAYQMNVILGWVNFNCKSYKNIAIEIDNIIKQVEQNSKEELIHYRAVSVNHTEPLFWPKEFHCRCNDNSPLHRGPERSPIFHLYQGGKIKQEVVGANLKALRKAIQAVYKVII
jgi:uncharacterized LabA/DUF88 family protein